MGAREIQIQISQELCKHSKIDKFLCVRFHFVKFEIYCLGLP